MGSSLCWRLGSLCSECSSIDRGEARRDPRSINGGCWVAATALNFEIDFAFGVGDPALAGDGTLDLLTAPVELTGVCMVWSSSFTNDPKVELAADGLSCRCLHDLGVLGALSLPRLTEARPSVGIVGGRSEPDGVRSTPEGSLVAFPNTMSSSSVAYSVGKGGASPAPAECRMSPCGTK